MSENKKDFRLPEVKVKTTFTTTDGTVYESQEDAINHELTQHIKDLYFRDYEKDLTGWGEHFIKWILDNYSVTFKTGIHPVRNDPAKHLMTETWGELAQQRGVPK